jgi:hypothetical protein
MVPGEAASYRCYCGSIDEKRFTVDYFEAANDDDAISHAREIAGSRALALFEVWLCDRKVYAGDGEDRHN